MRVNRIRPLAVAAVVLAAVLIPCASASAAITATSVTAPANGLHVYTPLASANVVTFSGGSVGAAPVETVDVWCLHRNTADTGWDSSAIAANVATDDATGAWTTNVDLSSHPGLGSCLVRALKTGLAVPNDISAFTGPTVYFADLGLDLVSGGPNVGTVVGWFARTGQSAAYNSFGSPYDYGMGSAWLYTGASLRSSQPYWSYAATPSGIGGETFDAPDGIVVDNMYAYLPDSAAYTPFQGTNGSDLPGFVGVTVSATHDATTGGLRVVETAPLLRCNADADQVTPTVNCTALVRTGVTMRRTWSESSDGRAVWIDEDWISTDGASHNLKVQYYEGLTPQAPGASHSFPWVSGGAFASLSAGAAVPLPPSAPFAWEAKVKSDAVDGDARFATVGRVTSAIPTTLKAIVASTSNLLQIQTFSVSAGGTTTLHHGLVADTTKAFVDAGISTFTDQFVKPSAAITTPASGATIDTVPMTVTGTASDNAGVTSLKLNGVAVTISGGTFTAPFTPVAGTNTLTLVAQDATGNATTVTSTFTYEARNFNGTDGADKLTGNSLANVLKGFGGDDSIACGAGGTDTAEGDAGNDTVNCVEPMTSAKGGHDVVDCGAGPKDVALVDPFDTVRGCELVTRVWQGGSKADNFLGTKANDRFLTVGGNDKVTCGGGKDTAQLGAGDDIVKCADTGTPAARKRSSDNVNCGPGRKDRAIVDRFDVVRGCEFVTRV